MVVVAAIVTSGASAAAETSVLSVHASPGPKLTFHEYPIPTVRAQAGEIVAGPDGALWFTESMGNKIGRITLAGRIREFPLPQPLSNIAGLVVGADGALWFTEQPVIPGGVGFVLGRITTSGTISQYGPLSPPNPLDNVSLDAGPDGAVWTTSGVGFQRITPSGMDSDVPIPFPPSELAPVDSVSTNIVTGPDGALWFGDVYEPSDGPAGDAIGRMTTSGTFTRYLLPELSNSPVSTIAVGPDDALWYGRGEDGTGTINRIGRITTTGAVTEYRLPTSAEVPIRIVAGPDGALWVLEAFSDSTQLARLTTSGGYTEYPNVFPASGAGGQSGIAVGRDRALWITETFARAIARVGLETSSSQRPGRRCLPARPGRRHSARTAPKCRARARRVPNR
jgi:virginiamycin B lyase